MRYRLLIILINIVNKYMKLVTGDFMNEDVQKNLFLLLLAYDGTNIIAVKQKHKIK